MNSPVRKTALAVITLLLFVLGLFFANEGVAHWFFADFHDSAAKWHGNWGNRFALISIALFAASGYAFRLLFKKRNAA